jgi:hypothetical protein
MKNNIMYPLLIIIFSSLIILAILQNRNNRKLNSNIENFMNNYLSTQEDNLKLNIEYNLKITKEFANGDWTFLNTTVDSNYNVSNLMTININDNHSNQTSNNYGTITVNGLPCTIAFITNEIIVAYVYSNPDAILNIKFINNFSKDESKINVNPIYKIPNTPTCIVSITYMDTLITKFASYKVNGGKVSGEVYRIIKAGYYLIDSPPEYYDFKTYNKIVGNYKFSQNLITITYGVSNNDIYQKIMNSYGGKIRFIVKRVFNSPSGTNKEITTKSSDPISLNVLSNNNIPNNIVIAPFSDDKNANGLTTFFKPKATILYFYKLTNLKSDYNYGNNSELITESSTVLNLQNNANTLFPPNIQHNDLNSLQRVDYSTYTATFVARVDSNLNDPTIIPFSALINIL